MVEWISTAAKQIEKMKCCGNCHYSTHRSFDGSFCHMNDEFVVANKKCHKWELAE